jgi:diguanylate cyclase (GGDEF)-like protein/PAS domain S-box-containing protein
MKNKILRKAKQIELLLQNIPAPVVFLDNNLKYMGCNNEFEKFSNIDRKEEVQLPFEIQERFLEAVKELSKNDDFIFHMKEAVYRQGNVHDMFFSRISYGNETFYYAYFLNVTEQSQLNKILVDNEKLLQNSLDAINAGVLVLDENGVIVLVNKAWQMECFDNIDQSKCTHNWKSCAMEARESGEHITFMNAINSVVSGDQDFAELEFRCPCIGSVKDRWHLLTITKYTENGGAVLLSQDITPRKLAQQNLKELNDSLDKEVTARTAELKQKADELQTIYDSMTDGMVICEMYNCNIVKVNTSFCDMLGYSEEELLTMKSVDVLPSFSPYKPADDSYPAYGIPSLNENNILRKKDGSVIYVDISSSEINYKGQKSKITFLRNVSERMDFISKIKMLAQFPAYNPNPILRIDSDCSIVYSNSAGQELLELLGVSFGDSLDIFSSDTLEKVFVKFENVKTEFTVQKKVFTCTLAPVKGSMSAFCYIEDITEMKEAQTNLSLAATVFHSAHEAIVITDSKGTILDVNSTFSKITGYEKEEVLGKNPRVMKSGKHGKEFYKDMWGSITTKGYWRGEVWDRRKNKKIYPKMLQISAYRNIDNKITHYIGTFTDISSIKKTEEYTQYLMHYDTLTGLPNRTMFKERLDQAVLHAKRNKKIVVLLHLDINGLKAINDNFGHDIGDLILKTTGSRLVDAIRETDTAARMGGDEFSVILTNMASVDQAKIVLDKIVEMLHEPFDIKYDEVLVNSSIGVTVFDQDADNSDELVANAETATLYAKKDSLKVLYYKPEMRQKDMVRQWMEKELAIAIEQNLLELYFQPRICSFTNRLTSCEALLRWIHPEKGFILPGEFIPLAEETGLILKIDEWVVKNVLKHISMWESEGFDPIKVSINISGAHFSKSNFAEKMCEMISATNVPKQLIQIELTESVIMGNPVNAVNNLQKLKRSGVTIAIDDFGTGYSSLSYLKKLPVDTLKVDKSFVDNLPTDLEDVSIVRAILSLAKSMGLKVTAEGVETKDQFEFLKNENADEIQGYYFSKPLNNEDFKKILDKKFILPLN